MDGWWLADAWQHSPVYLVSWVFWLVFSITLHELGHGWAAIRCGDRTPIELGHMTWNPAVHIGTPGLIAFFLFGIAWGAMPVNPSRFRGRRDDLIVSAAGPAMNVGLSLVCGTALGLWIALAGGWTSDSISLGSITLYDNVQTFLMLGCGLNAVLVVLNLLPIPPLDGSRILANVYAPYDRLISHGNAPVVGLILFAMVFFYGGGVLWTIGWSVTDFLSEGVLRLIAPRYFEMN